MFDKLAAYLLPRNTEWRPYVPLGKKVSTTGSPIPSPVMMGRKVNGVWEYREMTLAEVHDYQDREAW